MLQGRFRGVRREIYMERQSFVNNTMHDVVEEMVSKHRLASYLIDSKNDLSTAVLLYEWNNKISVAMWEILSQLEVGMRNSIDKCMLLRQRTLGRSEHWIFDDYFELGRSRDENMAHKPPYRDISRAISQVQKNGKPLTPSQIISETPFGFWNQLVGVRNKFLWPDLASAFSYAPTRDQRYVSTLFSDLRDIRNRISHHHKLHPTSIENGEWMILELAKALHPDFADWISAQSRVAQVRAMRPAI